MNNNLSRETIGKQQTSLSHSTLILTRLKRLQSITTLSHWTWRQVLSLSRTEIGIRKIMIKTCPAMTQVESSNLKRLSSTLKLLEELCLRYHINVARNREQCRCELTKTWLQQAQWCNLTSLRALILSETISNWLTCSEARIVSTKDSGRLSRATELVSKLTQERRGETAVVQMVNSLKPRHGRAHCSWMTYQSE